MEFFSDFSLNFEYFFRLILSDLWGIFLYFLVFGVNFEVIFQWFFPKFWIFFEVSLSIFPWIFEVNFEEFLEGFFPLFILGVNFEGFISDLFW